MEEKHCKWYNDEFCTNDKSPCVADYCPVVEYPELCKHREVVKDINVRSKTEDKKLTDEEIAKAILQQIEYGAGIPYINEWQQVKTIKFTEILDFIYRLQDEKTELQKQVDELKEENKELYKENTMLIAGSILERKDIAKDTAKEILGELDLFFKGTTFRNGYEFKKIEEKLKEIAKSKGVEVE